MLAILYWVLLIVWAVFGVWSTRTNRDYFAIGGNLIVWVLLLIIGLKVFPVSW